MSHKRTGVPEISGAGSESFNQFKTYLGEKQDITAVTLRNYLSDLRQFIAWYETHWLKNQEIAPAFTLAALSTPLLINYRGYLQTELKLKPATINRYFGYA